VNRGHLAPQYLVPGTSIQHRDTGQKRKYESASQHVAMKPLEARTQKEEEDLTGVTLAKIRNEKCSAKSKHHGTRNVLCECCIVKLAPCTNTRLFCSGRPRKFGIPGSFHRESSLPSNCQIFVNFSSQRGRARRLRGSGVGPLEGLRQVWQGGLEWRSEARFEGGSAGQHLCSHGSPHCVHTMRFLSLCMPLTSRRGLFEGLLTRNPDLGVAGERRTGQG
jgi:hypothetical protein